ncbi:MAG: AmmeMemoRadiSam system protein A [Lachnospiraceae bacterium]|nr:AmmeMemoRadiSam system protein A [Lachnospiraceae bacterium]
MSILAAVMLPHPPLIVPEIGRGEERKIQDTINAYEEAAERIGALKPQTIVLLSPHQTMYADYFHISPGDRAVGDFGQFGAAKVQVEAVYDTEFVEELCQLAGWEGLAAGTAGEREPQLDHGTMVPLYFVRAQLSGYRLVRIGLSGLPLAAHYRLGQLIQEASRKLGRRTVVIGSGDLSHRLKEDGPYGYRPEGSQYDQRIMDVMGNADFGKLLDFSESFCEKAGECGHRSFTILAGTLDGQNVAAERLSYEGPFGVGYGVCWFTPKEPNSGRKFGEQYEQRQQQWFRQLRGCIGTIAAVQDSIAEEIIENAISASQRDPRFEPIVEDELERLVISVDVLGEPERITSAAELDVKRYGVIVTKGHRRGLLLPNLDGVDTVEEQVAIARSKAGIGEEEDVELERFEVVRHSVTG